ncbi:unnamed protein product [Oncorhynchus mykiss]|uniref:VWFD domain-containing protein n=1 Tax=Oncorhynchus mykiss TaxID=8022 RepID=A0A060WWF8_ONCMY|nr:unnamed protein product [Oncorhynchus mykiss]
MKISFALLIYPQLSDWRSLPSTEPLASVYVKFFRQEIAFGNIDKAINEQVIHLATGPAVQTEEQLSMRALLSGDAFYYAKPLPAAEVRCIFPTAVGVPIELSFYTAAVATVNVQATIIPAHEDQAASHPAVIGSPIGRHTIGPASTGFGQTAGQVYTKVHTIPVKSLGTLTHSRAFLYFYYFLHFRIIIFPSKIVSYMIGSLVRLIFYFDTTFQQPFLLVVMTSNLFPVLSFFQSRSSKITYNDIPSNFMPKNECVLNPNSSESRHVLRLNLTRNPNRLRACAILVSLLANLSYLASLLWLANLSWDINIELLFYLKCTRSSTLTINPHIKRPTESFLAGLSARSASEIERTCQSAAFIRNCPLYAWIGKHSVLVDVEAIVSIFLCGQLLVQSLSEYKLGPKATVKIIKVTTMTEEKKAPEGKTVLLKLNKILVLGLKYGSRSSPSSSSSRSSSCHSIRFPPNPYPHLLVPRVRSLMSKTIHSSSSESSSSKSTLSSSSSMSFIDMKFSKNHVHRHPNSKVRTSSRIYKWVKLLYHNWGCAKYLGNAVAPAVTILIRAERADNDGQGYQIATYLDKATFRLQIILSNLAPNDKWRICADSVLPSNHKVMAKFAWGVECKEFETEITAETGLVGLDPAFRVKLTGDKLPHGLKRYIKKYSYSLHYKDTFLGFTLLYVKQIKLTVAVASERTLNVILKTLIHTFLFSLRSTTCFPKPAQVRRGKYNCYKNKMANSECSMVRGTLTTFNNRRYKNEMPLSCYQVLAQDCTTELKFMVLLKKDNLHKQNHIIVKISDIDIDMYPKDNDVWVKVNGLEVPINNLPYQHATGSIQIRQKSQGLSLFAPSHGLQEVYVDKNTWMVIISLNSCVLPLDIFTDTHTYTQIYIAKSVQSCHQGKGWLL